MKTEQKAVQTPIGDIVVLPFVERPLNKVADHRDMESIKKRGVEQALVCVLHEGALYLAKGLRRLRIATTLKLKTVPTIDYPLPKGRVLEDYIRDLRLATSQHRQDLAPSQKCELVKKLKADFKLNNKQVASYLGIDSDSVTNWLDVDNYIAPVRAALDSGDLTMAKARIFNGLTEKGQETILKERGKEIAATAGRDAHKVIRSLYPPAKNPEFYRNPKLTTDRLKRATGGSRKVKPRVALTVAEKSRLGNSYELREIELRTATEEVKLIKAANISLIVPVGACLRSEKVRATIPPEILTELERWAEIYI